MPMRAPVHRPHKGGPAAKRHVATEQQRGNSTQRGYGYRWQKTSKGWLEAHPLCAECERQGRVTAATEVDHITPHRGDMILFWDRTNWQSMCKPCHSSKTAKGE